MKATLATPGGGYPMHTTATVDLIVVVSGAMELVMDTGSTFVRAGDVVVQRGTPMPGRSSATSPASSSLSSPTR